MEDKETKCKLTSPTEATEGELPAATQRFPLHTENKMRKTQLRGSGCLCKTKKDKESGSRQGGGMKQKETWGGYLFAVRLCLTDYHCPKK